MAAAQSEAEAMHELAKQLWERFFKARVSEDLLSHSLDGYKATVITNNNDGTLTVKRPFDEISMTLRCPPALAQKAEPGDQVLQVTLGEMSNSFILCATDMEGFGSGDAGEKISLLDFSDLDELETFLVETESGVSETYTVTRDAHGRIVTIEDEDGFETFVEWPEFTLEPADKIGYDNSGSGASATNVQAALDELFAGGGGGGGPALSDDDPMMDGATPSPGVSVKASRADHRHQTDSSRASAADLTSHVQNTSNPHSVTKTQVGLDNVANERQYSAQNPPPLPTPADIGAVAVSTVGTAGGVASLDANGKVPSSQLPAIPSQPSDIGAQPTITASGILKGDGAGNVTAAVGGTDYQTPLTAGTDYATPAMIPTTPADVGALPADGTAKRAYNLAPSHQLSGNAGWYKVLTLTLTAGNTRSLDLLISNSYNSTAGILRIYMNKISSGSTDSSRVNWLTTTIPVDYVRWEIETVSGSSTMSVYFYKSSNNSGVVDFFLLDYKNRGATATEFTPGTAEWVSVSASEPTTANVATANILNNAATADRATTADSATNATNAVNATNALNDGNGDAIAASYVKKKNGIYYAVCNTPAATAIKSISIPEITELTVGLCINIEFPYGITDSSTITQLQLDVNGLGAVRLGIESLYNQFTLWTFYDDIGAVTAIYSQTGTEQGVPVYAWKVINRSHAHGGHVGLTALSNDVNSTHGYDEDGIPTAATPKAVRTAYNLAASKSRLLRFTSQTVSVASGAEIFRITDADITADTEVVSVEFADPSYIPAGGSWTSYAGYVAFTGTCTAATTADVILKI